MNQQKCDRSFNGMVRTLSITNSCEVQIFFDERFDHFDIYSKSLGYVPAMAFGPRSSKRPRRENWNVTLRKFERIRLKINGSMAHSWEGKLNYSMWLGSSTFIATCSCKCEAERDNRLAWQFC